ncbi:c-type cytochrome [Bacteroidota bacterium]
MDFLDNSVLPQSAHHVVLLKYLLVLAYLLFIPYMSVLLGSFFFSVFYNRKGNKTDEKKYLKYSKALIDLLTFNKAISLILGIVPFLSIIFSYAQLLHLSGAVVVTGFTFSFILFAASLILIYAYKYAFHLSDMLGAITVDTDNLSKSDPDLVVEARSYKNVARQVYYKSGLWGVVLLLISSYIFVGAFQLTLNPGDWSSSNFVNLLFSFNTVLYFLYFLSASFGLTFSAFLFYYIKLNNSKDSNADYIEFARKRSITMGLIFSIAISAFIVLLVIITPQVALSGKAIIAAIGILLLLTAISSLFYVMLKESHAKYAHLTLYLFLAVFALSIFKEHFNFSTASQRQIKVLAAEFVDYQNKLKEEMGIELIAISGSDIFNGRCSACHQFDQQLVGPSYNSVLPKYEGKKEDLVQFILNPVKVDANFPPMPNQGLKPKEAEAIADYIIQIYKEQSL